MAIVHVGLGANLGDPRRQVLAAVEALATDPALQLEACSPLYLTPPWGVLDQPAFVNAVVRLRTRLSAADLLCRLQALEHSAGRVRNGQRWGPRVLDLDLLLYGGLVLDTPALQLPHPRLGQRAFVLLPLADLDPGLEIPGQGRIEELLGRVDATGCQRLSSAPAPVVPAGQPSTAS